MSMIHESVRGDLSDLAAFAVVAEERSFTRAAARLGVSQSALSHTIRALERRLGLQLLARTTRSVSPTPAGNALLQDLAPALERIRQSLQKVRNLRDRPSGRLRLVTSKSAAMTVLLPKLEAFTKAYPEIVLDVTITNDPVDLVAGEFDAGIQIGEFIQRDMIAVRVSADLKLALVGSPAYFASRKPPKTPLDLKDHACIGFRFSSGMYRWEFEKGKKMVTFNPLGPASFDDIDLVVQAILTGAGIGMSMEHTLMPMIKDGRLIQVMKDWCPAFPGYFLYYPSRRNQPGALAALISTLRLKG
ncbi:LysR family transcriptional regulator [Edaphobacter dinghuensis]|uniref:LysR family transcriptional regulator n=1 Tax=Edaphobacter dinghuensis TaxID=1560005 RepID=A0A917H478_9BACT|nr:LysR family transcriptional regulator [Edaphobacter dinghuensis]GGG67071.1 LysR family transcriptional regulator [Edaphobacter dinghuensis]